MTMAEVIEAAMALSCEERSLVADAILSIDENDSAAIDDAWVSLAARRAGELDRGAVTGLNREEVKAFLTERRTARAV